MILLIKIKINQSINLKRIIRTYSGGAAQPEPKTLRDLEKMSLYIKPE